MYKSKHPYFCNKSKNMSLISPSTAWLLSNLQDQEITEQELVSQHEAGKK